MTQPCDQSDWPRVGTYPRMGSLRSSPTVEMSRAVSDQVPGTVAKQSEGRENEEATQRELGMRDEGCGHGSGELRFSFPCAICP